MSECIRSAPFSPLASFVLPFFAVENWNLIFLQLKGEHRTWLGPKRSLGKICQDTQGHSG